MGHGAWGMGHGALGIGKKVLLLTSSPLHRLISPAPLLLCSPAPLLPCSLHPLRHELLEVMDGGFQGGGETAAVEGGGGATDLHSFDYFDVFFVGFMPQVDWQLADEFEFGGEGFVADEVEGEAFLGTIGGEGIDGEDEEVVGMDAQHHIGEGGDVFGDGGASGGEVGEGGQLLAVDGTGFVEAAALPDVIFSDIKSVMVFHAGAAIELGVNAGEMVAFGEVFDGEFPVGVTFKAEFATVAQLAEVVVRPAIANWGKVLGEGGSVAGEVDEN